MLEQRVISCRQSSRDFLIRAQRDHDSAAVNKSSRTVSFVSGNPRDKTETQLDVLPLHVCPDDPNEFNSVAEVVDGD
jgi:hypothetical protein